MKYSRSSICLKLAIALAAGFTAGSAGAAVTFSGSSTFGGTGMSASATFSTDGHGDLIITLVNTFAGDTPDQSHILTAVFFSGANGLTPVLNSAVAPTGSKEWNEGKQQTVDSGSVLGQQWQYLSGLKNAPDGATAGISSTGLNLFSSGNFAAGGQNLDGSPYGILSTGYAGTTGDGLKNHGPYIQESMMFTLIDFKGSLSSIGDVFFQCGTTLGSDPGFAGNPVAVVPEANFGLGALASLLPVIGFVGFKRLTRRGNSRRH
jgi:hypothetical protein